ncbi:MAG: hypothetical protein GY941_20950 [Planctomycetes bacterium]|nr:hypothetical protein [Planctomycetota bacterium]
MPHQNLITEEFRAEELDAAEREVRDAFIAEFMRDYDPVDACIRIGFLPTLANEFAAQFMSEGYVLRAVLRAQAAPINEDQKEVMRAQVVHALWKEANSAGRASERIASLGHLSKILSLDPSTQPKGSNAALPAGGVMVVPAMTDPDTWSAMARESQRKLKETVRD